MTQLQSGNPWNVQRVTSQIRTKVLLSPQKIEELVYQLGNIITRCYDDDSDLVLVGILNASFMFVADLVRAIGRTCIIDFMRIGSYGDNTKSSGKPKILMPVYTDVKNKHVILVDTIVETGNTLKCATEYLLSKNPLTLNTCFLVDKRKDFMKNELDFVSFIGTECPDHFVFGYGLDYQGQYRGMRCIVYKAEE